MIDAVITYVDGSDKNWLDKYRSKVTKPIEETETRYRSYDCLDLQVRLIRKFMKFVDNIFIVVDSHSQVEKYSFTEEDNVTIVTHEEIIPKRYLPCFNSCTIEMFFYNIKDLKENFVYFNDDFFVTNECEESDFFINGKPCLTFIEKNIVLEDNDSIFDHNIVNSCEILKNNFPVKRNRYKCVKPSHFILPLKKSAYTYIWTKCFNDMDKSLTRTRHRRNYNVYLFANYEYYVRSYVNRQLNSKYYTTITWPKQIYDDINIEFLKSICINDEYIYNFENWKTEFRKLLTCLIDNKKYIYEEPQQKINKIIIEDDSNFKVALCAMGKNENLYIREWVEWYKNLGINKIFLYDNNELDGEKFEDVINDYIESGFVNVINVRGKTKYQLNAYIDFYNTYSKYYNWCCFFDIDEFLVLNEDNDIVSYLQHECFSEFNSIAINWKNYGDNNLLGNENNYDRTCLSRFTNELLEPIGKYNNEVYKKIIRGGLRQITKLESPHTFSPSLDKVVCNNEGTRINGKKYSCECNYKLAYLKHFCTKTILEYILKSKRGGGVNGLTTQYSNINNFFIYNEQTSEKNDVISKFLEKDEIINLLVVNYNTPNLIDTLIKNINLQVKSNYHLYVFDNSDKYECYKSTSNNITVFDNTHGQIINFDEWLTQFPDRFNCWARNNNWGSAKHCYSVEKCMELINDNFILLDSDILIKKDISELYRDDLFYVGEIYKLKTQNLPRISPYVCFINVKLCKLYGIHYFYPQYMHGLSKDAHDYDTGGAFYKFVNKYQHLNIKCDDYITHFGQGSWSDVANKSILKKKISIDDWLKQYRYLYNESYYKHENLKNDVITFVKKFNNNINLDNPKTIQDKINWLKVYDVNELKGKCSDKIKVHKYSIEKLGKDICIPIIKVYDSPDDIVLNELPNEFVLKCNHGYNMNIICKEKSSFNLKEAIQKCKNWLNTDFGKDSIQLQYSLIDKKCFIEKYMFDENQTESLYDYKFWCFNGEPKLYTINNGNGHGDILYYTMDHIPFDPYLLFQNKDINTLFEQPNNFDLMVSYAKKLSEDFKFVRVDFYEINNIVYLGELTFTPGNGIFSYKDKKYNKIIGDMLELPKN